MVVQVLHECQQGQLWPIDSSSEAAWTKADLWKVLRLSGGATEEEGSSVVSHEELVNMLLARLHLQNPFIYAIRTTDALVVNSQSMQVKASRLDLGLFSTLETLKVGERSCETVWKKFAHFFNQQKTEQRRPGYRQIAMPEDVLKWQRKALELQTELKELKDRMKKSPKNQNFLLWEQRRDETEALLKQYREQLEKCQASNYKTQLEQATAQRDLLERELQQWRNQLRAGNVGEALQNIQRLKQELKACQQKRA